MIRYSSTVYKENWTPFKKNNLIFALFSQILYFEFLDNRINIKLSVKIKLFCNRCENRSETLSKRLVSYLFLKLKLYIPCRSRM